MESAFTSAENIPLLPFKFPSTLRYPLNVQLPLFKELEMHLPVLSTENTVSLAVSDVPPPITNKSFDVSDALYLPITNDYAPVDLVPNPNAAEAFPEANVPLPVANEFDP